MKTLLALLCFSASLAGGHARTSDSGSRVFHAVVAQDGSGDYATLQDAIDDAPSHSQQPYLIYIKAGRYHEHVLIPAEKPYIHLVGQGRDEVTVWDDRVCGGPNGTPVDVGATIVVQATDCLFEGITFENAWGTRHLDGPQALAMYTKVDRAIVSHCALRSYQDTYRTANERNERNYVAHTTIEGAVDFIYGQGNVLFDSCRLEINRPSGGWIVAPKHDEGTTWGYVLRGTTITAAGNPAATSVWLGRPWRNSPMAVFIDTRAEVTLPEEGWYDHMGTLPKVFAEYGTTDATGQPVDLSRRISRYYKTTQQGDTIWGTARHLLTAQEAARYTPEAVMRGTDDWRPFDLCRPLASPVAKVKGRKIAWTAVAGARGYVVEADGHVVAITAHTSVTLPQRAGRVVVRSVSQQGVVSR